MCSKLIFDELYWFSYSYMLHFQNDNVFFLLFRIIHIALSNSLLSWLSTDVDNSLACYDCMCSGYWLYVTSIDVILCVQVAGYVTSIDVMVCVQVTGYVTAIDVIVCVQVTGYVTSIDMIVCMCASYRPCDIHLCYCMCPGYRLCYINWFDCVCAVYS